MAPTTPSNNTKHTSSSPDASNAWEVYESTGDASAALKTLPSASSTPTNEYNRRLLEAMTSPSKRNDLQSLVDSLAEHEEKVLQVHSSGNPSVGASRKRRRNEWTLTYNRAVILLAQGRPRTSMSLVWEKIAPIITSSSPKSDAPTTGNTAPRLTQDLLHVACRMAFVLLEGILLLSSGSASGIATDWKLGDDRKSGVPLPTMNVPSLLQWLSRTIDAQGQDSDQLKFALSLFTARMDHLQRDSQGKLVDAQIRSARKDLKQAMEIFQQKLKPAGGDAGSLASSVSGSLATGDQNNGNANSNALPGNNGTIPPGVHLSHIDQNMNRVLQRQNQAALNLKANSEQLKSNLKKSLILSMQAQAAVSNNDDETQPPAYDAMHYNNLAVTYETNGKPHLALHAWSKALSCPAPAGVESDGTVRLDSTFKILHNATIGSLQARNYLAAYECMGTCLQHSEIWSSRPKCWLRLGEACLGLWSQNPSAKLEGVHFKRAEIQGETKGIVLTSPSQERKEIATLVSVLASPSDLEQVQLNPLPRARYAFERALELIEKQESEGEKTDVLVTLSAKLSLSYICLEDMNYEDALEYAEFVLKREDLSETEKGVSRKALFDQQQATARMYAAEAACALGDAVQSMTYLVGDGKNDAFDRLATALGGVSLETAANHGGTEGKMRLAKAQAMVRCSASAATANLGNLAAAKQLAMSAQAISREGSYACRALVYCMLREGNRGAALTLLRSAR